MVELTSTVMVFVFTLTTIFAVVALSWTDYQITSANATIAANTFSLTATPVAGGPQASDAKCTSFTLTHLNVKSAAGSASASCW